MIVAEPTQAAPAPVTTTSESPLNLLALAAAAGLFVAAVLLTYGMRLDMIVWMLVASTATAVLGGLGFGLRYPHRWAGGVGAILALAALVTILMMMNGVG